MMKFESLRKIAALSILLGVGVSLNAQAQSATTVISLDPPENGAAAVQAMSITGHPLTKTPANFRTFSELKTGEQAAPQRLTLRFAETTHLMTIQSTPDFKVEPESTCGEGNVYSAKSTCTLLVRFTPQGPGHRVGKLTITQSNTRQRMVPQPSRP